MELSPPPLVVAFELSDRRKSSHCTITYSAIRASPPASIWWIEPVRHGEFRIDQPFLSLPNVIASPHNSAQSEGAHDIGLRRAVENCRRALTGETPLHVIGLDERLVM